MEPRSPAARLSEALAAQLQAGSFTRLVASPDQAERLLLECDGLLELADQLKDAKMGAAQRQALARFER